MKKILYAGCACLLFFFSCKQQQYNRKMAIALNDSAMQVAMHSGNSKDSIQKEIVLLDSAIKADRTFYVAYANKINSQLAIGDCNGALTTIDTVLSATFASDDEKVMSEFLKGNILQAQGNKPQSDSLFHDVLNGYDRLIQKSPANFELKANRIFVLALVDGKEAAMQELDELKPQVHGNDSVSVIMMQQDIQNFNGHFLNIHCQ